MAPLTIAEVQALPAVVPLLTAARAFGLSRNTAYRLVKRGEFPCRVIQAGDVYKVPTVEILNTLGLGDMAIR
ncbi:helix-turn-helix transcriptional regulator [Nonomuraea angiospora]|uniref:helix-turn-helix transcriptional regulator n=1 Tax=Nonomuraea angiospora TaxID=46172 RepID=UPI00299FF752|nr:helix-turn-helix domain-containing protein [Nonomuraea angiospora]MDX3106907.1 helix-turn-helix domain-containing protein [Nonomuraea angiospora]